jgi:hypothetical protein
MIKISFFTSLIFLLSIQINCKESQESQIDNDVYILEHSIDLNEFKEICKLNMRKIRENQNTLQLKNMPSYVENTDENRYITENKNVFSTKIKSNDFDADTLSQLLNFKTYEDNHRGQNSTLYRLRLCRKEITQKICVTSTFTYLKNVIDSNMRINLNIYTGINNCINSMSIKTSSTWKGDKNSRKNLKKNDLPTHLKLFVYIQNIKTAVGPDTKSEAEAKEKSARDGSEYSVSTFWAYAIPVFILYMYLRNQMNLANLDGAAGNGR